MNHNMRKMYTEQEIAELIAKYGGTKLYHHHITLDYGIGNDYIDFISTSSKPLNNTMTASEVNEEFKKYVTLIYFNFDNFGDGGTWLSFYLENPNIHFIGIASDGTIIGDDGGNIVTFPNIQLTDTVTPL